MPYAANGKVSTDPFYGAVHITTEEYSAALLGMINGKLVSIDEGFTLIDPPEPEKEPDALPLTPEEQLAVDRAGMKCSRLQGRLVLGEQACDAIDAIAMDPETPWAMRQTILHAIEWDRLSEAMTELGYLLGYQDEQMDALFRQAMLVKV